MRATRWTCVFGLLLGIAAGALAQSPPAGLGPSPGGTYALTFDRGKALAITSLSFSDPGVSAFGTASDAPSQVFVTTSTGVDAIPEVVRSCVTGGHFGKVVATYTNAQGHVEYTFELKRVSVVSVIFPGVDKASNQPDDLTWTLDVEEEHFNYQLMKASGSSLSEENKKRLERSHDRIQASMWRQIKRQAWHGPTTEVAALPRGRFHLEIEGLNTSGVFSIGPLAVERNLSDSGKEKALFVPLRLTIDSALGEDFAAAIKSGKPLALATLTYSRITSEGGQAEIRLVLKGVKVKPEAAGSEDASKSTIAVMLEYEGLDVKVTS